MLIRFAGGLPAVICIAPDVQSGLLFYSKRKRAASLNAEAPQEAALDSQHEKNGLTVEGASNKIGWMR